MAIKRIRGPELPADVVDYLRAREPAATGMLAAMTRPDSARGWRLWLLRRDGDIVGALLSVRYCFDRWTGLLLLDDLDCAQEMAQAVDRSNAWTLIGPAEALEAVVSLASRGRRSGRSWFHHGAYVAKGTTASGSAADAAVGMQGDVVVRSATDADLQVLVALYAGIDRVDRPPWRRERGAVRRALPSTLVAESPRGVVGAIVMSRGDAYVLASRTVVEPSLRGGRIAYLLVLHAALTALAERKGFCGFRAEPAGLRAVERAVKSTYSELFAAGEPVAWASARLWPPKRFRGQTRLRRAIEAVEDRIGRPVASRR